MGINKIVCCLVILVQSCLVLAQNQTTFPVEKKSGEGTWRIERFAHSVLKVNFTPFSYVTNEQLSNAVLTKAIIGSATGLPVTTDKNNLKSLTFQIPDRSLQLQGYFDSAGYKGFRFYLSANERIMGAGERSVPVNRRGYKLQLYNNPAYGYSTNAENLNYSVPFIISSEGYGIFFDNPSKGYLDIGKNNPGILEYGASSGKLDFYIIPGKNAHEILSNYHQLTGTQPLPARWVFGNLMSRFGYRSSQELTSIVKSMQEQDFPVDAVILDLFWFGDSIKGTLGNLDWMNKKAWPDPRNMIRELKSQGIKTILITEPFVLNTTSNFEPSKKWHATDSAGNPFLLTDFYFGKGGLLDIFRKGTQDWFWTKYKKQVDIGVAGWWGDLGEPEKHPEAIHHNLEDLGFKRLFRANEVHNLYGHFWDKMLYDRYAKEYPATRLFNLNRSGYAGSPRYGVFPWSGDVSRSWQGLQSQLPLMIGMSLSGVPYIHADAGGFAGGDGDKELYTRWLQFATFTPVFRPHGTAFGDVDTSVKNIPSEAALYEEPYKSIVRKTIQLRYQLLPYNYTLAYEQARYGKPLVRPLFYYNNGDSNLYKTDNQYMWGDAFLVAPVLQPTIKTQQIFLPEGDWYVLHTDQLIKGGQWISQDLSLENIPVFVKAGSFVPMFKSKRPVKNTGEYAGKEIVVKYYPGTAKSSYVLFDDDGFSKNSMQKGNYELIRFDAEQKNKKITISIKSPGGKFLQSRNFYIELPAGISIKSARVNNRLVQAGNNKVLSQYKGKPITLELELN